MRLSVPRANILGTTRSLYIFLSQRVTRLGTNMTCRDDAPPGPILPDEGPSGKGTCLRKVSTKTQQRQAQPVSLSVAQSKVNLPTKLPMRQRDGQWHNNMGSVVVCMLSTNMCLSQHGVCTCAHKTRCGHDVFVKVVSQNRLECP